MQLRPISVLCTLFAASIFSTAYAASFSAGINISEDVSPEKTGLLVYPDATPIMKKKGDSESVNIQFAFGEYGLKVVVAKLRSNDAPGKVAAFYRSDLARFGAVLDCGSADEAKRARAKDKKSNVLTCENDKPRRGGMLYKVGSRDDQHVVEIKSAGDGSEFSLVHVNVRSPE